MALWAVLALALGLRVEFATNHIDHPAPDARGYARIAQSLYENGQFGRRGAFGGAEVQEPTNYSPGTPLLAAGIYYATGGVKPLLVRLVFALLGTIAVFFTFLIGRRLAGVWAGVLGAIPLAIYPSLLEYHGMIMSEPLAIFTLSAAVLSFLWASDDGRSRWAWLIPGLLFGLTALTRPEYLTFGFVFLVLVAIRRKQIAPACIFFVSFLLPIVPWTIHNYDTLHRFVPLSTGGGKALFIGTYLPGDGLNDTTKTVLLADNPSLRRYFFNENPPPQPSHPDPWLNISLDSLPADGVQPQRLISQKVQGTYSVFLDQILDTLAAQQDPSKPVDSVLASDAKRNFWHYLRTEPLPYAGMFLSKAWHMWRLGPRDTMRVPIWVAFHAIVVVLGLIGMIVLARRRRWEALVIGVLTLGITAEGTLLLAAERRVLVLMPLICALAGAGAVFSARIVRARRAS